MVCVICPANLNSEATITINILIVRSLDIFDRNFDISIFPFTTIAGVDFEKLLNVCRALGVKVGAGGSQILRNEPSGICSLSTKFEI